MLNLKVFNIFLYFIIKQIIFFCVLMVLNNDFTLLKIVSNIKTGEGLFIYLWMILFFPIVEMILFSVPIYNAFKVNKFIIFLLIITIIMIIEYFLYVYFTTQHLFDRDAMIKTCISILLLVIFFYKKIPQK
jgi:hypothetical protein